MSRIRARILTLGTTAQQFLRFALVGGLGTATNLLLFYLLVDIGPVVPLVGALLCFAVAVSQNYVGNEFWTFAAAPIEGAPTSRFSSARYAKFVAASLLGFAVSASILVLLLRLFAFPLAVIPQAMGIAAGMAVNFVASRQLVFRRKS